VKNIAVIVICFVLTACAASNVRDLRDNSSAQMEFKVEENYQRVYKNLLDKMHECVGEGWAGVFASYHINSELYNELGEGEISFMMSNAGMQSYYMQMDVASLSEAQAKVNAYVYYSTWEKNLPLIKQWAVNGDSSCDLEESKKMPN